MTKRIYLGLGSGGLRLGSFCAGFIPELGRRGKLEEVTTTAACSVNTLIAPYAIVGHLPGWWDKIEDFWRNKVHGKQVFSLTRNPPLNLDYLDNCFREGETRLDTEELDKRLSDGHKLIFALTDRQTGLPINVQPQGKDVLEWANHACSIPGLYNPKGNYMDAGFTTENIPLSTVFWREEGKIKFNPDYDEAWIITNTPPENKYKIITDLLINTVVSPTLPKAARKEIRKYRQNVKYARDILAEIQTLQRWDVWKGPRLRWIEPKHSYVRTIMDSNKERINRNVDLGIQMARDFARQLN